MSRSFRRNIGMEAAASDEDGSSMIPPKLSDEERDALEQWEQNPYEPDEDDFECVRDAYERDHLPEELLFDLDIED
ncbi:MAG: hypothetical protein OXC63_09315 [Aestuariivita sp.]|nr:hypothetical protein [Aestuariivita sp.]MCY4347469.1 hypothetical protein [Aestuariivita sp.]